MSEIECLDHRIPGTQLPGLRGYREQPLRLAGRQGPGHRLLLRKRGLLPELPGRRCGPTVTATNRCTSWKAAFLSGRRRDTPWRPSSESPGDRSSRSGPLALKQMLAERKDILLVDVRSEKSYKEGHIEGAVNIPLYRFSRSYSEIPLDRTVILVDDRGFRTFLAGSYLEMKGYRVMRLFGGMQGWQEMRQRSDGKPSRTKRMESIDEDRGRTEAKRESGQDFSCWRYSPSSACPFPPRRPRTAGSVTTSRSTASISTNRSTPTTAARAATWESRTSRSTATARKSQPPSTAGAATGRLRRSTWATSTTPGRLPLQRLPPEHPLDQAGQEQERQACHHRKVHRVPRQHGLHGFGPRRGRPEGQPGRGRLLRLPRPSQHPGVPHLARAVPG